MDERSLFDELSALVAGSLTSEEERRLRERCAADAKLQAALDRYVEVHALTELSDAEPPPCRLAFEEVEVALDPHRVWRMVLRRSLRVAAAVLVLVGSIAVLSHVLPVDTGGGEAGREPLVLAAIPLMAGSVSESGKEVPALLADYRPVERDEIRWIDSFETAQAMARVSSRPVLLFLQVEGCGFCSKMRSETFAHSDVKAAMDAFIPVMIDAWQDESIRKLVFAEADQKVIFRDGWPWFGALNADGGKIHTFPGMKGPGKFVSDMQEALRMTGPAPLSWEQLNTLASKLVSARKAMEEGRMSSAFELFSSLDVETSSLPFREDARWGLSRIGERARETLLTARELSLSEGADAALAALDTAVETFVRTPYAEDLESVRDELAHIGRFPEILDLR